jgi:hypothetical protein
MLRGITVTDHNVLHVNRAQEQTALLDASHEVVRCLIASYGLTLIDLSEKVDCTVQTISNAFNKKHTLSQAIQTRIGRLFGPDALDPIAKLSGGRMVPLDADDTSDALPPITAVVHNLAVARSPNSPGGEAITHGEILAMEPDIDAAMRVLSALKVRANAIRAAA